MNEKEFVVSRSDQPGFYVCHDTHLVFSSDPADTDARFFIVLDSTENIDAVDGTGRIAPASAAVAVHGFRGSGFKGSRFHLVPEVHFGRVL